MKLGIMQPYFIPYIGYWQLLNAVDKYVIYDDVNYIKGGWINRNRILINGKPQYFNIPMHRTSQNKLINELIVNNDPGVIRKNLKTIEMAYKKAPYFNDVYPLMDKVLNCNKENLAEYITDSIRYICEYLDIKTELIVSSELHKDCSLRAEEKLLSICDILHATDYYNAIGGRELYTFEDFQKKGIRLSFVKTNPFQYQQFHNDFVNNLSILDVMMFNSKERMGELLNEFTLITE